MLGEYLIKEISIKNIRGLKIKNKLVNNAKYCNFNSVRFQKRVIDIVYDK